MDAIDRYRTLATVSASLAVLLVVGAILLRVAAFVAGILVVLLVAACFYFIASMARVRRIRERQ
ncbi:MAG: hypothetical protein ACAH95_15390 [Fimbriimonas sp.]